MILETRALTKRFRRRTAVHELSLGVERGDVYGFLGPNGAGKTTTLRMMVGLIRPTSGTVTILGETLSTFHRAPLGRIGAIIETPAFYTYLSGRDNLRMMASLGGGCAPSRIDEVLDRVELRVRAGDPVRIYSHGMKQRLAIAAALLPAPEIILLDEPTNGLDPMGIRDVRALVRSLASDDRLTVFLSSHLLSEVQQICTRGAILRRGEKIWEGRVDELLGERQYLRVRATPTERAIEVITGLGATCEQRADLLLVRDAPTPEDLVAALVAAGCRVAEIAAHVPSLEEVFVELVDDGKEAP
ncbi:MAG TPA: ABC transporter ATP-binding protein [Kofleriaceae bacterium]|nr:ABC transporter ATP-binding protein [Kofleriaceae bacterium]